MGFFAEAEIFLTAWWWWGLGCFCCAGGPSEAFQKRGIEGEAWLEFYRKEYAFDEGWGGGNKALGHLLIIFYNAYLHINIEFLKGFLKGEVFSKNLIG